MNEKSHGVCILGQNVFTFMSFKQHHIRFSWLRALVFALECKKWHILIFVSCSPQCTCLGFWFMLGVLVIRVSFHMRPVHLTIWWLRVDIGLCLLEPHLSTAAVSLGLFWRGQTDSELWRHTVCRACHHLPFINMTTVCIICTYVLYHPPMAVCLHFLMNVFGAPQSAAGLKEIGVSFRIVKQGMRGAASTGGQTRRLCSRPRRY